MDLRSLGIDLSRGRVFQARGDDGEPSQRCRGRACLALRVPLVPTAAGSLNGLVQVGALLSGTAYYLGFAPPRLLIRAWQEPELRRFLERAATLPRLPDTATIVRTLEDGAARTMGAGAALGLWDADNGVLRFANPHAVLGVHLGVGLRRRRTAKEGAIKNR